MISLVPSALYSQTNASAPSPETQEQGKSSHIPDLKGPWAITGGLPSFDPDDPHGMHPENLPMTPWALERLRAARPPFGA
ncbi:MAG: hypothetical protein ACRD4Y_09820, partial [Candidatus Acidiferrales bacterium]